ncbi:MAG: hypothetical protein B7Y75_02280 [Azorhizobium sp. 35-67-5]|nr:MAG: hypothetical protein B7Y75_02280 [Azorhizobium sp. 35-67-5]
MTAAILHRLDRLVGLIVSALQWFALPLIVLLFLQWPFRDIVRNYSREANDLGQWIFALYVAVSVTAATRAGTHLAADAVAQRYSPRVRHWLKRTGAAAGLAPWALLVIYAGWDTVLQSVQLREAFPDTNNPGYFLIKLALWLMAFTILLQCIVDVLRPCPADDV